ncbi:efflux RND transporter periplasmic adaptor subunit [Hyphomicrobium facile]|uniref:RND family efflux transporter, MFP subunit n=1 Tax=Hyphomicrobium facile TaxID=51670 RepID=A0A1I7NQV6_9HYPH|nr:HlyD family secretion protein [Hyphomicrobium facile]SFV37074.1 RND family efflux transporter, MFP subunit [Hyphomicrobium facile]
MEESVGDPMTAQARSAPAPANARPFRTPSWVPTLEGLTRKPHFRAAAKILPTVAIAGIAVVLAAMTWQYYVQTPWTRNGAVRVQVANVAPQVSGQIIQLPVTDNKFVHKGDLLYAIDPFDFEVAVRTAQAAVDQRAADLQVKQGQSARRQRLTDNATTPEEQQVYAGTAAQAQAAYDAAVQQLALAKLNLKRTRVTSPVNGYVTNLLLRVGDYAVAGQSNVSVADSDSFWVDGYFEETKLSQICLGDRVEAKLMSYPEPITGHVETITRGISVANAAGGAQGLPSVDPIYTWVRLAQRIPVRVAIDNVPQGVPLVSGMTATVTVAPSNASERQSWLGKVKGRFDKLGQLFEPPMSRPNCLGAELQGRPVPESLPAPQEGPAPSSKDLAPGLVPGIDQSPRVD